jgi:hypothetical protein
MTLIIQIAVVLFLCYAIFVTFAAIVSIFSEKSDMSDIWTVLWTIFGFICLVILFVQNPDKMDFRDKLIDEYKSSGLGETRELLDELPDNNLLKRTIESAIGENLDKFLDASVTDICNKYVKRSNYILFSTFSIKVPFSNKINFIGVGGYFFKINDSSLNKFIQ